MAANIFGRYVWLIDTIRRHKRITYEEINNLWINSGLSYGEGDELPLRTFHNHRKAIKDIFDVYISITIDIKIEDIERIKTLFSNANIFIFENRGRDVLPFLKILNKIYDLRYETLCKVHSKKSLDRNKDGLEWGKKLRMELFNNSEMIINKLLNNEISFYADEKSCKSFKEPFFCFCIKNVKMIAEYLNVEFYDDFIVPVGTMFWCKTKFLRPLINLQDYKYFSIEAGYLDNQLEHTIEQVMGLLFLKNGSLGRKEI